MNVKNLKLMMDTCYLAKRTRDLLPKLPDGVCSSYIQYLDVITTLEEQGRSVRVSDISYALGLPRPGVTRTVKEMTAKGYLTKSSSSSDGRITYITSTPSGHRLRELYDTIYFSRLSQYTDMITDADAECTIRTIKKLHQIMIERRDILDSN